MHKRLHSYEKQYAHELFHVSICIATRFSIVHYFFQLINCLQKIRETTGRAKQLLQLVKTLCADED